MKNTRAVGISKQVNDLKQLWKSFVKRERISRPWRGRGVAPLLSPQSSEQARCLLFPVHLHICPYPFLSFVVLDLVVACHQLANERGSGRSTGCPQGHRAPAGRTMRAADNCCLQHQGAGTGEERFLAVRWRSRPLNLQVGTKSAEGESTLHALPRD